MLYISERQQLIEVLEALIILLNIYGEDDEAEYLYLLYLKVLDSLYTAERAIISRPPHYFTEMFPSLTMEEFSADVQEVTRKDSRSLSSKILDHPVFSDNSTSRPILLSGSNQAVQPSTLSLFFLLLSFSSCHGRMIQLLGSPLFPHSLPPSISFSHDARK